MVGGYAMIDCTGLDLTGESLNIPAIYQQLTEQNAKKNKPVLLYNLENDGEVLTPTWSRLSVGLGGTRDLTIDGYIISVEADGDITVTESGGGSVDPSDVYTMVDGTGISIVGSGTGTADFFNAVKAALTVGKPIFIDKLEISSGDPAATPLSAAFTYNSAYDIMRGFIGNKYVILAGAADSYSITIS